MTYAGYYACKGTFSIKRNGMNSIFLLITTAGTGELFYRGKQYRLSQHSVMLIDTRIHPDTFPYLQKEFHEVTGKTIEIHPNNYYKELLKQPEKQMPEPVSEKNFEELPNLDVFRNEVEEAIEGLRCVEGENYFGYPQLLQTFTTSVPIDKDYARTFFEGLLRNIADHIFEKSVPASKLLDFDGRIIDCEEIPMQNLERALHVYQTVLSNYPQYSEQLFEITVKILNRNYIAPTILSSNVDDDNELPF